MDDEKLQNGSSICFDGMDYLIHHQLGTGGQGEVWLAESAGKCYAVKWYFPHTATQRQCLALEKLVARGSPDSRFLWPISLGRRAGSPIFGYLMDFRQQRFREAADMMLGKFVPHRKPLALACAQVADCLFHLHTRGLCYGDVSYNNVAFDPETGEVRIFDNDNVRIDSWGCKNGEASNHGVADGTPGFMAPEIVRGLAKPNKETDKFSLAVLLFYMLLMHHPFEGKLLDEIPGWDPEKDLKIFGQPAPFIFHPTDDSNALPEDGAGVELRWSLLPTFLRNRFIESFVKSVNDPGRRVVELVWRDDLLKLHDCVLPCRHCASENFFDRDLLRPGAPYPGACWKCQKPIPTPMRLGLERGQHKRVVPLSAATKLYPVHIADEEDWSFGPPQAEVTAHPANPARQGLLNRSESSWLCTKPDGSMRDVKPGQVMAIENNSRVQFGRVTGIFRI